MTYDELYTVVRILTGLTVYELDNCPVEDLEQIADKATTAAKKEATVRGLKGLRPVSGVSTTRGAGE